MAPGLDYFARTPVDVDGLPSDSATQPRRDESMVASLLPSSSQLDLCLAGEWSKMLTHN